MILENLSNKYFLKRVQNYANKICEYLRIRSIICSCNNPIEQQFGRLDNVYINNRLIRTCINYMIMWNKFYSSIPTFIKKCSS